MEEEYEFEFDQHQMEIAATFQELTGIDDIDQCREILDRHNWDLETAVQDELNIKEGRPSVFSVSRPVNNSNELPVVHNDSSLQQIFVSNSPRYPIGGWRGILGLFSSLFRFVWNTFTSMFDLVQNIVFNRPRHAEVTDPIGDVMSFINKFEESFGSTHPAFFQGTYAQALANAKADLRFFIVYLHSDNQESLNFCRNTLVDTEVVDFLNSHAVIFWACSVDKGEGRRVLHALRPKSYPFVGVIIQRENVMTLVGKLEGHMDNGTFIQNLQSVIDRNAHILQNARTSRMERLLNQTIREQQDEAYMESLRADQEKQKQKELVLEELKKAEMENIRLREEENQKKIDLENKKVECSHKVPVEPEVTDPECVCISFKMPNGDRLERKFLSSHTLKHLYFFIFSNPNLSSQFEIASNFPKRVLDCTEHSEITLFEAGLGKKELLFVYDLES